MISLILITQFNHKKDQKVTKYFKAFWLADGVRKPMFDYERMLYKALLEPGYLNSTPSLHSDDPPSLNVCQSIPRACLQKYKSLGKYSCHARARNTNTLREIWVLILLSSWWTT